MMQSHCVLRALRWTTAAVFAYLCAGELLPLPLQLLGVRDWQTQQVVLLTILTLLPVLNGRVGRNTGCSPSFCCDSIVSAMHLLSLLNTVPIAMAAIATPWALSPDGCPREKCGYLSVILDSIGIVTARLARLDLGICLLHVSREKYALVPEMTNGSIGYTEAIPLHRAAGWWCAGQSALHSVAYIMYYLNKGGPWKIWTYCFPVPSPGGFNRLGLVNMFGVIALLAGAMLALAALPWVRYCYYHIFQRLHLPFALIFLLCCALHDLPILFFVAAGLADWYLSWRNKGSCGKLPARAKVLHGTSGPWIELTITCHEADTSIRFDNRAPRGQWVGICVPLIGIETHPFSVASLSSISEYTEISFLVSTKAGDWTRKLLTFADDDEFCPCKFEAIVSGPYSLGGGTWSIPSKVSRAVNVVENVIDEDREPMLLLLAGGIGIAGWLPALNVAVNDEGLASRRCRIVWCVKTEGDYFALASKLPRSCPFDVTVFITRGNADNISNTAMPKESMTGGAVLHTCSRGDDIHGETIKALPSWDNRNGPIFLLMSVIVGLVTQNWIWWGWLVRILASPKTALKYTLMWRILPVIIIVGSMAATVIMVECMVAGYRSHLSVWLRRWMYGGMRYTELEREDDRSRSAGMICAPRLVEAEITISPTEESCPESCPRHEMRNGRPNFTELVRETASKLCSEGETRAHMVVAACGPPGMIKATREAVNAVKKSCDFQNISFQFCGTDSCW